MCRINIHYQLGLQMVAELHEKKKKSLRDEFARILVEVKEYRRSALYGYRY